MSEKHRGCIVMETSNAASYTARVPFFFFLNGEERKQDRLLHTGLLSSSPISNLIFLSNFEYCPVNILRFTATALFVTPHSTIATKPTSIYPQDLSPQRDPGVLVPCSSN